MAISSERLIDVLDLGQTAKEQRSRMAPKRARSYPPEQVRSFVKACEDAVRARLERIARTGEKIDPQTTRLAEMIGAELGITKPKLDRHGRIDTSSPFDAAPGRAPRGEGSKNRKRDLAKDRKAGRIEPDASDLADLLDPGSES